MARAMTSLRTPVSIGERHAAVEDCIAATSRDFRNAAVDADVAHRPTEYVVAWRRFDNAAGTTATLGETRAGADITSSFIGRAVECRPRADAG